MSEDKPISAHVPEGYRPEKIPLKPDGSPDFVALAKAVFIGMLNPATKSEAWETIEAVINGERCFFMMRTVGGQDVDRIEVAQSCLTNTFAAGLFQAMDELAPGQVTIGPD